MRFSRRDMDWRQNGCVRCTSMALPAGRPVAPLCTSGGPRCSLCLRSGLNLLGPCKEAWLLGPKGTHLLCTSSCPVFLPGLWGPLLPSGRALTKGGEGPPLDLELTSSEGHSHKETLRWPNMLQGGSPSMTMTPAPNLPPTSCLPSYRVTWTALAAPHSVVTDLETVSDCLLSGAQVSSLSPLPG